VGRIVKLKLWRKQPRLFVNVLSAPTTDHVNRYLSKHKRVNTINIIAVLAILFIASCTSEKNNLKRVGNSKEYQEYLKLINESIMDLRFNALETIDSTVLSQYETVEDLVSDSIIDQNSKIYKHLKNFEKVNELSAQLEEKYGLNAREVSIQTERLKDNSIH